MHVTDVAKRIAPLHRIRPKLVNHRPWVTVVRSGTKVPVIIL